MGRDRTSNSGFTLIAAGAAAAVAYWIFSAQDAPTVPFAIAQYTLLGSLLVGGLDSLTKCRVRR